MRQHDDVSLACRACGVIGSSENILSWLHVNTRSEAQIGTDSLCFHMQCKEKPKGDKYGFTHFARSLNSGKGIAPLSSDSRRRADRYALEASALLPGLLQEAVRLFISASCASKTVCGSLSRSDLPTLLTLHEDMELLESSGQVGLWLATAWHARGHFRISMNEHAACSRHATCGVRQTLSTNCVINT